MTVEQPCLVEAHEGEVVIECGHAGTSLTPTVAEEAGRALIREAARAREQDGIRD